MVDDEAPIREMLVFAIEQNGFQAIEAQDYDSAMEALTEPYPDMILLDWMLPGTSGVQIAGKIKNSDFTHILLSC